MMRACEKMSAETKGNETMKSFLIKAATFRLHTHLALEQKKVNKQPLSKMRKKGREIFKQTS